jgi:hypothetical protein
MWNILKKKDITIEQSLLIASAVPRALLVELRGILVDRLVEVSSDSD